MRFIKVFQLVMVLLLGVSVEALASSARDYLWGPPQTDFVRPFLEEAKLPHNARWADDEWSPKDWIDSRGGSVKAVVDGLYRADIVVDQYIDDVPVLEVGQGFLELGAQDQRRVVAFMDEVFGITKFATPGIILVLFHRDDKSWLHGLIEGDTEQIGVFDANGLQLQ